ncbi:MAG: DUF1028 domain-containing protein [Planctomycetota bacterium]
MAGRVRAAAAIAACAGLASTADATWSILLVDTRTGEIALGSATCLTSFDLRAGTPVVITGVGAATAQSSVDSTGRNRSRIRDGLALGLDPQVIFGDLAGFDPSHQSRQYGLVDVQGRAGTFTGGSAGAWAGGEIGEIDGIVYAVQGNLLTGPAVVDDAIAAILGTPGDLAEKLMAGMEAAQAIGGDARCSCPPRPIPCGTPPPGFLKSADIGFMIIARAGDTDACNGLYRLDGLATSVAIADLDGDGAADVVTAGRGDDAVSTLANATPSPPVGSPPFAVLADAQADGRYTDIEAIAAVDVTGDGVPDLIAADGPGQRVLIAEGDGAGGFGDPTEIALAFEPNAIVAEDFDGGAVDVFVAGEFGAALLSNDGAGGLAATSYAFPGLPQHWAAGDYDGDGDRDLAYATSSGGVAVVTNDGAGGLALGPIALGLSATPNLVAADLDDDGDDEIIGGNRSTSEIVLYDLAGGVLSSTAVSTGLRPNAIGAGAVTAPGSTEVVVTVSDRDIDVLVFSKDGAGGLTQTDGVGTGLLPRNFVLADLTGDGLDELVAAGSGLSVLSNIGGTFASGPGCAAGDYFMNFNVPFQPRSAPDPVFQLRDLFDDWRADLVGLPDAIQSFAELDPVAIPASAGEVATLRIEERDWRGDAATTSIEPQVAATGEPSVAIGPPMDLGNGVWEVELTVQDGSPAGELALGIVLDNGIDRAVTLMPAPVLVVESACYADFDSDGALTLFDFLAFQNAFQDGLSEADCDADGSLTLFDFLCFQNAFDAGCG